ncbi:MAG: ribonuclease HII [Defluviitaleaceae bacterium]|nr:ribonuclease HII [Defluviitaleaceae bacterium]
MKIKTAPNDIENALFSEGISPIAGVDEAGRGPLAGPVVACAIILPHNLIIEGVNDSKKVSEKRREKLSEQIKNSAISYAYGIILPEEIDQINILQATLKAMALAINALNVPPKIALIDGTTSPKLIQNCKLLCVKKGDSASHLIAAASILAKTKRDTIMRELHEQFPEYAWDKNKGYGTAAHISAIHEHGLSPAHRKSFTKEFANGYK